MSTIINLYKKYFIAFCFIILASMPTLTFAIEDSQKVKSEALAKDFLDFITKQTLDSLTDDELEILVATRKSEIEKLILQNYDVLEKNRNLTDLNRQLRHENKKIAKLEKQLKQAKEQTHKFQKENTKLETSNKRLNASLNSCQGMLNDTANPQSFFFGNDDDLNGQITNLTSELAESKKHHAKLEDEINLILIANIAKAYSEVIASFDEASAKGFFDKFPPYIENFCKEQAIRSDSAFYSECLEALIAEKASEDNTNMETLFSEIKDILEKEFYKKDQCYYLCQCSRFLEKIVFNYIVDPVSSSLASISPRVKKTYDSHIKKNFHLTHHRSSTSPHN